jgi:hypothetical protein
MKSIFIILHLISYISFTSSKLRFVFDLFRHGARTPQLKDKNTDIYGNEWNGTYELTSIGLRMHYILGRRNRNVYKDFLNEFYIPSEIYFLSTDKNRTIMSAYAQLLGLYQNGPQISIETKDIAIPPVEMNYKEVIKYMGTDALKNKLQPIPIHVIDYSVNWYYLHDKEVCPASGDIPIRNISKKAVQEMRNEFIEKYAEKLKEALGIEFGEPQTFKEWETIFDIADSFIQGNFEGYTYEKLTAVGINLQDYNNMMLRILYTDMYDLYFESEDYFLGHMSMSPLMGKLLTWMEKRIELDSNGQEDKYIDYIAPKMLMLSGHDTNIAAMQGYFRKVFPEHLQKFVYPVLASSLFVELHMGSDKHNESYYEVRVVLNDEELFTIPFSEFKRGVMKDSVSREFIDEYCGFNIEETNHTLLIMTFILVVICIGLILAVFVMWRRNKREALME